MIKGPLVTKPLTKKNENLFHLFGCAITTFSIRLIISLVYLLADDIQLLAFGILSDYLSKELSDSLSEHLNLDVIKSKKRKQNSDAAMNPNSKKIKLSIIDIDDGEITPTPTPVIADKKTTTKAKQLAKSAKGSKNIMSFFKAK